MLHDPTWRGPIRAFLARNRRNALLAFGARHARGFLEAYDNRSDDIHVNGESDLIRAVGRRYKGGIMFDVGANVGEWSAIALSVGATVHAFEIVPEFAEEIQISLKSTRLTVNAVGLLDCIGVVPVNKPPGKSGGSNIWSYYSDADEISGAVMTGDSYCSTHNIDMIDLLKLDIEGAEGRALMGFEAMLKGNAIRLIQFEYGRINVQAGFFLRDFYTLLEPYGYRIGRLYPSYIDFQPYSTQQEDVTGANYVAALPDVLSIMS